MFGWLRRIGIPSGRADFSHSFARTIAALTDECTPNFEITWTAFQNDKISRWSLADQVDLFAFTSLEYVERNYATLMAGPAKFFWLMILTAILRSGTHAKTEINNAAEIVRRRHPQDEIKLYELKDSSWPDTIDCRPLIEQKWRYFQSTLKFRAGVTLADQIELFNGAVLNFVNANYPALTNPFTRYWMLLFTAIQEADTHPEHEVISAFRVLEQRYAASK